MCVSVCAATPNSECTRVCVCVSVCAATPNSEYTHVCVCCHAQLYMYSYVYMCECVCVCRHAQLYMSFLVGVFYILFCLETGFQSNTVWPQTHYATKLALNSFILWSRSLKQGLQNCDIMPGLLNAFSESVSELVDWLVGGCLIS